MNETTRRKLLKKLTALLRQLKRLTASTYYQAVEALRDRIQSGETFLWNENGAAEKRIMSLLHILEGRINIIIANGVSTFYKVGLDDAASEVSNALKGGGFIKERRDIKNLKQEATEQRRIQATAAHAQTVSYRNGALNNLSNRVWSFKDNAKKEIETIVQKAISEGRSVKAVQDDIKQFLNTGKGGEVMAAPGTGVYNSVTKNCERLMRTEMMAAYRSAEIDSYQGDDAVLGYTIRTSGNHMTTTKKADGTAGKPEKLNDICDQCAGDYPKNFYWTGWHPNCRCVLTPITLTPEQFGEYMDADDRGRAAEYIDSVSVHEYPEGFRRFVSDNLSKMSRRPPAWLSANPQILTK